MMASSNPAAAARYTPGSWLGVVRAETVVLLRPDSAPALVESLWDLLDAGPEVHEVLDAVTSASGGSLARLPWFAIVDCRSSVQVFLRGDIDLTVDLPSGPVELSGRDVTTWTERRFAAADGFNVTVPDAAAGTSGVGPDLPLTDGVVLLQGLRVQFTGAGAADAPAVPAAATAAAGAAGLTAAGPAPDAETAAEDEVLAAAEADIAAELSEHGASAETVLEFPGEDSESDGTLHEEPQTEPELEPEPGPDKEPEPEHGLDEAPEPEPEPAEQELTSSYDHLWERTVMRNIEDAAVREDPDAEAEPSVEPARDGSAVGRSVETVPPVPSRYPGPLQRACQRQTERKPQPLLFLRPNRPRLRARRFPPD